MKPRDMTGELKSVAMQIYSWIQRFSLALLELPYLLVLEAKILPITLPWGTLRETEEVIFDV